MAGPRYFVETRHFQLIVALACVSMASWNSGCSNHGPWKKAIGGIPGASVRGPSPSSSPAHSPAAEKMPGNGVDYWICADSQCQNDTIKSTSVLSRTPIAVETIYTEKMPAGSPASICRIREKAQIWVDERPDSSTVHGEITHDPVDLLNSAENTHDCQDLIAKLDREPVPSSSVTLNLEKGDSTLTFNGIRYRHLSTGQLQAMNINQAEQNGQLANLSGEWACIDAGCESLQETISADRKSLITESTVEFPDHQKCRVRETARLDITDDTDPLKIYGTWTRAPFTLVDFPENTANCADLVNVINEQKASEGTIIEQISFERDGNQELLFRGRRFVRKKAEGSPL